MSKILAIKGHPTRGKEVIELLEMIGGCSPIETYGLYENRCYLIKDNGWIGWDYIGPEEINEYKIFTLEEFLEKYPYKLNDFVLCNDGLLGVITKMGWDCEKSDIKYHVSFKEPYYNKWYSSKNIKCKFMEAKCKTLAIKGHPTRGKEVIELLEMMGGKNKYYYKCNEIRVGFTIGSDGSICRVTYNLYDEFRVFTLEEFLEKYPFKVGDKAVYEDDNDIVVISEIKWDDTVGDIFYNVKRIDEDDCFLCPPELLKPYKGTNKNKFGTAKEPLESKSNAVKLVDGKVVDDLEKMSVKNHKMGPKSKLPTKYYEDRLEEIQSNQDIDKTNNNLNGNEFPSFEPMFKMNDELEYKIPDGYEISEVSKDKVFIKPIKTKYPKTYKECCDVLLIPPYYNLRYHTYEHNYGEFATSNNLLSLQDRLNTLGKLIICRNAYWKIAGEQMGLGKPWEPDWENLSTNHEFIKIDKGCCTCSSRILVFPTEEMRDVFYKNFKDLIEQCKELL